MSNRYKTLFNKRIFETTVIGGRVIYHIQVILVHVSFLPALYALLGSRVPVDNICIPVMCIISINCRLKVHKCIFCYHVGGQVIMVVLSVIVSRHQPKVGCFTVHYISHGFQWLATGLWFSPGTPVSSTNKTDCYNITEILLKVALNNKNLTLTLEAAGNTLLT
jgi:hypothetical protein